MNKECTNREIGRYLHAYEISALDEKKKEVFEKHILSCDSCFEKIKEFENESYHLKHDSEIKEFVQKNGSLLSKKSISPISKLSVTLAVLVVLMLYPSYVGIVSMSSLSIRPVEQITLISTRSADNVYTLKQSNELVLSIVYPDSEPHKQYALEIYINDQLIFDLPSLQNFDSYNTVRVIVPKESLAPGNYHCILKDNEENDRTILQQYNFKII